MDKYVFKPYSPLFPALFRKEKERIAASLQKSVIEHVGSTAVPGLGGKGIIDIAVGVPKGDIGHAIEKLQALGYEYRPAFSTPERAYLIIFLPDPEEGTRRYHVHVMDPSSSEWKGFLSFRDYLRSHAEAAREYEALKRKALEEAGQDGKAYRKIKEPIFKKVQDILDREEM